MKDNRQLVAGVRYDLAAAGWRWLLAVAAALAGLVSLGEDFDCCRRRKIPPSTSTCTVLSDTSYYYCTMSPPARARGCELFVKS